MMMIPSFFSPASLAASSFVLLSLFKPTAAVKCGQWYSTDCLSDSDRRYDSGYTNDLKQQESFWKRFEGYYIIHYDYNINPQTGFDYNAPRPVNPNRQGPGGLTEPYGWPTGFYNYTFDGSRVYSSRYYLYEPANQSFCEEYPDPAVNVVGNGTCGVNGIAYPANTWYVGSYEKDGRCHLIGTSGLYPSSGKFFKQSNFTAVGEVSFQELTDPTLSGVVVSTSGTFLDTSLSEADGFVATNQNYFTFLPNPLQSSAALKTTKVTREEWLAKINETYEEYNILMEDRVQDGVLPMQTECNTPGECPTEEDWCQFDPNCSVSPYQEPDGELKAGPIVGIVVAAVVIMGLLIGFLVWRHLKQIEARARTKLTRRIAETIPLRGSERRLSPDALAQEFNKIDTDLGGTISKQELWDFLQSGKAGDITESDFNVLFAAIDHSGTGEIDFFEFISYFGKCNDEFERVKNNMSIRENRASFAVVASKSMTGRSSQPLMQSVKEEGKDEEEGQVEES